MKPEHTQPRVKRRRRSCDDSLTYGDTKKCKKCGEVKHTNEFGRHLSYWDGKNAKCRVCMRKRYK